jgi:hypothetical protein
MDEDDILYGNVSARIRSKLDLRNSHMSVIDLSRFNFSKKRVRFIFLACSACSLMFAFFQINMFVFTSLFILSVMSESIYTISWCTMTGAYSYQYTRE